MNTFLVILQKLSGSRIENSSPDTDDTCASITRIGCISITSTDSLWGWPLSTLDYFYPVAPLDRMCKACILLIIFMPLGKLFPGVHVLVLN